MRGRTEIFFLVVSAFAALLSAAAVAASAGGAVCPNAGSRTGASAALPDCRAYEQVSPLNKNGNDAGAPGGGAIYAWATADGERLLYPSRGPMGTVHRGIQTFTIGRRGPGGWSSEAALPGGSQERIQLFGYPPRFLLPSSDLSHLVFSAASSYVLANPESPADSGAIYRAATEGEGIEWLSEPRIDDPQPPPGEIEAQAFQPAGASDDLGTVYFAAQPTLVPVDAERDPGSWSVYEYSEGRLESAGVLPDGSLDPRGATPPNTTTGGVRQGSTSPDDAAGQVSDDGATMYFLSPDPAVGTPQLYIRRDWKSRLVSHTEAGQEAPSGAAPVSSPTPFSNDSAGQYVFGAADGELAYFHSVDPLTAAAPDDGTLKTYRYEVASGAVAYIPGVDGPIAAASEDGRRFLFGGSSIGVWDQGAIRTLDPAGTTQIAPARATSSGSAFVFSTAAEVPGFDGGGQTQIYHYDLGDDRIECVSCPPAAKAPAGPASLSSEYLDDHVRANRGMTADGRRVFFDTPSPLAASDTNGKRDVYEWTEGEGPALISSGKGDGNSIFLDNSADGGDVFFATADALLPGDTDGAFDVYDARSGGGFTAAAAEPCTGEACQGAPAPAPSFGSPATRFPRKHGNAPSDRALRLLDWRLLGRRLKLALQLPRPGRLVVAGPGIRSEARHFARGGRHRLLLVLRPMTIRALRRRGRNALKVRVTFVGADGRRSEINVRLKVEA